MEGESQEGHLPADAGCSRAVLFPGVGMERGVREREARAAGSFAREAYVHPAYVAGELPCEGNVRKVVHRQ